MRAAKMDGRKVVWGSVGMAAALAVLLTEAAAEGAPALTNLALSATGSGLLPDATLYQGDYSAAAPLSLGKIRGIFDGDTYFWSGADVTSPRSSTNSSLQGYLTWSSPEPVRLVRVWRDASSQPYDAVRIDTLVGTDPTVEANWVQRYDTGTGINSHFVDVDLGASYSTYGVRIRTSKPAGIEGDLGEVAVLRAQPLPGSLTSLRAVPTGATASSDLGSPANAINSNFFTGWRSGSESLHFFNPAFQDNPGSQYLLDISYNSLDMTGVCLTFGAEAYTAMPSTWSLLYDTGSGLQLLGSYTAQSNFFGNTMRQYYYDFGTTLSGVTKLELAVDESALPLDGFGKRLGVEVAELEAFNTGAVPEPCTIALLGIAALGVLYRRPRR